MDEEVQQRMKEVEEAVLRLDPSIRGQAFAMMRDYILTGGQPGVAVGGHHEEDGRGSVETEVTADFDVFFQNYESEKDFENALAAAAFWYSQYGTAAFSTQDIRDIGDKARVTLPTRIDKTLGQVKRDGKPLFRKLGRKFAPTPRGERYMRGTYGVRKGVGAPLAEGES